MANDRDGNPKVDRDEAMPRKPRETRDPGVWIDEDDAAARRQAASRRSAAQRGMEAQLDAAELEQQLQQVAPGDDEPETRPAEDPAANTGSQAADAPLPQLDQAPGSPGSPDAADSSRLPGGPRGPEVDTADRAAPEAPRPAYRDAGFPGAMAGVGAQLARQGVGQAQQHEFQRRMLEMLSTLTRRVEQMSRRLDEIAPPDAPSRTSAGARQRPGADSGGGGGGGEDSETNRQILETVEELKDMLGEGVSAVYG